MLITLKMQSITDSAAQTASPKPSPNPNASEHTKKAPSRKKSIKLMYDVKLGGRFASEQTKVKNGTLHHRKFYPIHWCHNQDF